MADRFASHAPAGEVTQVSRSDTPRALAGTIRGSGHLTQVWLATADAAMAVSATARRVRRIPDLLGCPNPPGVVREKGTVGAFVIVLREAFEAALVIGLVLAFLNKTGQRERHAGAVWQGTAWAVVLSVAMGALLFVTVGEVEGTAEQLYEGTAMLLAALVLTWMVFWMRRQAKSIGGELRARVGQAVATRGRPPLPTPAFVA